MNRFKLHERLLVLIIALFGSAAVAVAQETQQSDEDIQVCPWGSSPVSTGPNPEDFECPCWAGFERDEPGDCHPADGEWGGTTPTPPTPPPLPPDTPTPPPPKDPKPSAKDDNECFRETDRCLADARSLEQGCKSDLLALAQYQCGGPNGTFPSGRSFEAGSYCPQGVYSGEGIWPPEKVERFRNGVAFGMPELFAPCEKICVTAYMEGDDSVGRLFPFGVGVGPISIDGRIFDVPGRDGMGAREFCEGLSQEARNQCYRSVLECTLSTSTE